MNLKNTSYYWKFAGASNVNSSAFFKNDLSIEDQTNNGMIPLKLDHQHLALIKHAVAGSLVQ